MRELKSELSLLALKVAHSAAHCDEWLAIVNEVARFPTMTHSNAHHERILKACDSVCEAWRMVKGLGNKNMPESFWKTRDGAQVAKAYHWVYGDELITYTEAAMLLYDLNYDEAIKDGYHRTSLTYMTTKNVDTEGNPQLRNYCHPAPEDPRYPLRLLKKDILALKERRATSDKRTRAPAIAW